MKTLVVRAARTKSLTLQIALCIGSLAVAVTSHEAAAQDAVPFDTYFFFSADDQSLTGMARAIFACVLLGGVIALAGSLLGVLIGSLVSRFSRR